MPTQPPILSICIPTHDGRAACLVDAVESVLAQVVGRHDGSVEICVSDNGSSDRTAEILAHYKRRYPAIFTVHRFERNMGGHVNFMQVVKIAHGEYCWFLGSDDKLAPGAIDTVVDVLQRRPGIDGLTCNWRSFDRTMRSEVETWSATFAPRGPAEVCYTDGRAALRDIGLFMMYMSAQVFRRQRWLDFVASTAEEEVFRYRHFMHAFILTEIAAGSNGWVWLSVPLVFHRSDNMSLVDELDGSMHLYMIETTEDIVGCWRAVLGADRQTYRTLMGKYLRHWSNRRGVSWWKNLPGQSLAADVAVLKATTSAHAAQLEYWIGPFWRVAVPGFVYRAIRRARRALPILIAPRTRMRRILRLLGVTNDWTVRYDEHVRRAKAQAQETTARGDVGTRASDSIDSARIDSLLSSHEPRTDETVSRLGTGG